MFSCPKGYNCNPSQGKCDKNNTITGETHTVAWSEKVEGTKNKIQLQSVPCPDGQSVCPDDSTCCPLNSGQFGCCPLPKAVCCDDHQHCW